MTDTQTDKLTDRTDCLTPLRACARGVIKANCAFQVVHVQLGRVWTIAVRSWEETSVGSCSASGIWWKKSSILFRDNASAAVFLFPGICWDVYEKLKYAARRARVLEKCIASGCFDLPELTMATMAALSQRNNTRLPLHMRPQRALARTIGRNSLIVMCTSGQHSPQGSENHFEPQ